MGVGADVDWLVGSPDVPELTFSPVKFDPDKFLSDMTKDPDNLGEKGKGGDEKKEGSWTDEGGGKDAQTTDPKVDPKKEPTPKEDLTKLDDNEKYMRALDEVGKIGDAAKGKGLGKGVLDKKLKAIKAKYALQTIEMVDGKDESIKVHVRQKDKDNSANLIEVKLLSPAELLKQFNEAVADLELKLKLFGDPKTGAVTKAQAEAAAHETDLHFEVIDGVSVTVEGDQVVIKGDVGVGAPKKMASKPLAKGMEPEVKDGKTDAKTPDGEQEREALTLPQKQEKLDQALKEAETLLKDEKISTDHLEKLLPSIRQKYGLKTLRLEKGSGEGKFHVFGQINPEGKTPDIALGDEDQEWIDAWRAKQDEVEATMQQFVPIFQAQDETAEVRIRGSLATGVKMNPKKKSPDGRRYVFNPTDFDIDAYVVSEKLFTESRPNAEDRRKGHIPASRHPKLRGVLWDMRRALAKISGNRDVGEEMFKFTVLIRQAANAARTVREDQQGMKRLGFDESEGNPIVVQPPQ